MKTQLPRFSTILPRMVLLAVLAGAGSPLTHSASITGLGDLTGGSFSSIANGVSDDGSTVVGRSSGPSGTEAFRWTSGGGMVGLGDLSGGIFNSRAYGVSGDGSTVVGQSDGPSGTEVFRWTSGGGMVGLGDLPGGGFLSQAYGVSGDGSTVVGRSGGPSGNEAFRWTSGGGMVGLGDLPGGIFSSVAAGVSGDGSTVVGYSDNGGNVAFVWTLGGGMESLYDLLVAASVDVSGWSGLSEALGVSADGRYVVGHGTTSNGTEAFLVDLAGTTAFAVPEPSTYAAGLAVLGAAGSLWWRQRRRQA